MNRAMTIAPSKVTRPNKLGILCLHNLLCTKRPSTIPIIFDTNNTNEEIIDTHSLSVFSMVLIIPIEYLDECILRDAAARELM